MPKTFIFLIVFSVSIFQVDGQEKLHYNLVQLLKENKLITNPNQETQILHGSILKEAISTKGIVWLKDVSFTKGTIEVDLRGKNIFLQSFLGIAFHAVDSTKYDAVYFRPFNFKHEDTLRRQWLVQYFSMPDYDYVRLRKESPKVYENAVTPIPNPNDWFHATIIIGNDSVIVYVNHSAKASLEVKLLNNRSTGKIGLWTSGLSGDFANLTLIE